MYVSGWLAGFVCGSFLVTLTLKTLCVKLSLEIACSAF